MVCHFASNNLLLCNMNLQKYLSFIFIALGSLRGNAQQAYPKDYFRNPLDIPILLAGNFGECRPGHFHSGIDIKTGGKENLAVHAAADGYISRIKIEKGGFGHALYVTHPNGYTTLYAHLNNFAEPLQKFLRAEEYKKQSWEADIALQPSQFPVKKGYQIAWSGNTGASTAPHLHFEIRNTQTEHPLNPLLFGFDVKDDIAPKPTELALYDMSKGIYMQTPRMLPLHKSGDIYTTDTVYVNREVVALGLNVNDYMNGSDNTLNFYTASMYMNEAPFITITLDDIGYDETRYQHAFSDYKAKKQSNKWIQLLLQMDGNRLDHIYTYASDYRKYTQRGRLEFGNDLPKKIRIELADALGNKTTIAFTMICKKTPAEPAQCSNDLFAGIGAPYSFNNDNVQFTLDEKALYEPICFEFKKTSDPASVSDRYMIHKAYVPVHTWFDLRIKPNSPVPVADQDKIAIVYNDGTEDEGKAAKPGNGWFKASVRNFGEYRLVLDKTAPIIKTLQPNNANLAKAGRVSFSAKDDITAVKKFRGELDGKWICFEPRGDNFFYEFDEHCGKGKHTLVIKATDDNGNTSTLKYNFTR